MLVGIDYGREGFDAELAELTLLAESAGAHVVDRMVARRKAPDAALGLGTGKADELKALVAGHGARCVIFDQPLTPAQQRNLERHLEVEVLDRTLLILTIFAARAQSAEGKLQVELARLQYLSTRLVRRWSHLERQRGGIGARGGPGETQIELDRRMIGTRIKALKERLTRVKRQRQTQRRARHRQGVFRVSLVGYTNAGKSTLFNALTKARSYTADQLFATLDTTTRQLWLAPAGVAVSLSDTVGFIRDLPHGLIEAFEATLQEAADADLLLHVVDASDPGWAEQMVQVQGVLDEIGAGALPQLLVFNKIDRLAPSQRTRLPVDSIELDGRELERLQVSAVDGTNLDLLRERIGAAARAAAGTPEGTPAAEVNTATIAAERH